MGRTIIYKPSDKKAVEILNAIKKELGIVGTISTDEERRKAREYLRRQGWDFSMLSCNPDVYGGADARKKALCMLFNEMRAFEMEKTIQGNEAQLKKYGEAFRKTYEENKRIYEIQKKAIESDIKNSRIASLIKSNTPKEVTLKKSPGEIRKAESPKKVVVTMKPKPDTVRDTVKVSKARIDVRKFAILAVGALTVGYILKKLVR